MDVVCTWAGHKEFKNQGAVASAWAELSAKHELAPRAAIAFRTAALAMGGDLGQSLERETDVRPDTFQQVAKYYNFCTSVLGINKKDLPKVLTEKLDKFSKADRFIIHMLPVADTLRLYT